MTDNQGGADLDQAARYPSPSDLSEFLLAQNQQTLERAVGPDVSDRFRQRRETVSDLVVGAVCCGLDPVRLFHSLDVP